MKRKKDNAGMTLLEVIIAVSIFSIAAIVLLQSFVTSGRINRKSNLYLEATSTAQNIMEEIKSKSFADVAFAFNYPIDNTQAVPESRFSFLTPQIDRIRNGSLGIREMQKGEDGFTDVRLYMPGDGDDESKVTASVISKDGGKTYKFNPRLKGNDASRYYFEMTNVTNLHESFDALVEFDGSEDSGYKKKTSVSTEKGKNDYLMPNITKLNSKTNAFLIMEKKWDENAMRNMVAQQKIEAYKRWNETIEKDKDYANSHEEPQELDQEDVYAYTRRILEVRVREEGGTVIAEARYTLCAYEYQEKGGGDFAVMNICPCGGADPLQETRPTGCFCTYQSAYVPFYSSEAGEDLKNIYVFYYPNYNSTREAKPLDEIIFDNTSNYPVNLYVTKQRDEMNGEPTSMQENGYRMSLTIEENPAKLGNTNWNTNPSLYTAQTQLRTNLDYNISDFENIDQRAKINQMKLTYQAVDSDGNKQKKVSGNSAKKVLSYNGLDDKAAMDMIYTAKVSVYKAGAAAKGYPQSDLVATLEGAKEN